MSDLAYRHAWNTGFEQRFAELGMMKEANKMKALLRAGELGAGSIGRIAKTYGVPEAALVGMKGPVPLSEASRLSAQALSAGARKLPGDPLAARNNFYGRLSAQRGKQIGENSTTPGSTSGGGMIPTREGFGATPANYLSKHLWNDRSNLQRAGIGYAGLNTYASHQQARGAQNMYDRFEEEHPILAGVGRLFGAQRPGYWGNMLTGAVNPLKATGLM